MSDEANVDTMSSTAGAETSLVAPVERRRDFLAACGIFLFAFGLYLLPAVCGRPICFPQEARTAVAAREMLASGPQAVTTINGEPRPAIRPVPVWLVEATGEALGGKSGATQRIMTNATLLPSALMAALAVLIVTIYGCVVFGRAIGLMAGLMLAFATMVTRLSQIGSPDATLLLMCAGALCGAASIATAARPGVLAAIGLGLLLGFGALTKGLVPLALLVVPVLVEVVIRRKFNLRKVILFAAGMAIAATIVLIWAARADATAPGARAALTSQFATAFAPAAAPDRLVYYPYHFLKGMLPWTVLLALGLVFHYTRKPDLSLTAPARLSAAAIANVRFFVVALLAGFAGFYAAPEQHYTYLLPLMVPLAFCGAYLLGQFQLAGGLAEENMAWAQLAVGVLATLLVLSLPFWPARVAGTLPGLNTLRTVLISGGIGLSIGVAVAVLLVHVVSARAFVDGKPLMAVATIAIFAYVALAAWSWQWSRVVQRTCPVNSEIAGKVLSRVTDYGRDVRLYSVGFSQDLLIFYLNRPVWTADELAREPAANFGSDAPLRAVLFQPARANVVERTFGITVEDELRKSSDPFVLKLLRDVDWAAFRQSVHKQN